MVRRAGVLHFELYIDGLLQQSTPFENCEISSLLNGVAHLFKEALTMPKPSDSLTSSQVAKQQLGELDTVGSCDYGRQYGCKSDRDLKRNPSDGQSPAHMEYLHGQYFNQDIATHLPVIVAYPQSMSVNLQDLRCRCSDSTVE